MNGAITFIRSEVARYFGARAPRIRQTSQSEWRGPCPIHQGKRDSFAVNADTGLWRCHSECNRGGDLIAFERIITGADFPVARAEVFHIVGRVEQERPRIVATYPYVDERGELLYEVVRYEPKNFKQRRPDGRGGWIWKKGERQVLFHLPEVIEAPIVFVVEGEKDVETLRSYGFVSTTNAGGSKAPWLPEYTETLAGREVIVIPDADEPGRERGRRIVQALFGKVAKLIYLELNDGSKDITQWFERGHSEVELIAHVEGEAVSQ